MKTIIFILTIVFVATGCNKSENVEQSSSNNKLIGQWQLIEIYEGNGGSVNQWNSVENGYNYEFNSNGSFSSDRFVERSVGNYILTDNTITLDFSCEEFNTGTEIPSGIFIENFSFDNNNLVLVPSYLNCDEGCGFKFSKIKQ
ncbi:hypothetical protein OAC97_00750 [Flavobacteriaceae bacterium]|nr:hypothetical protein [Flavobacteriaceae bacterium]